MAKLRFDSNGNPEWEGTPQELLLIYAELKQKEQSNAPQIDRNVSKPTSILLKKHFEKIQDMKELSMRMPTVEQLRFYILGKPKFEHDIVEVEKKFFGKQINSRHYGRLYRELRAKLEIARKSIEESQRGTFKRKPTPYRNLPAYTFEKVTATPLDMTLQKTS